MVTTPDLDALGAELAHVREAGLEPLDVEPQLGRLPTLTSLDVIRRRTRTATDLAQAQALCSVVKDSIERLVYDEPETTTGPGPASAVTQALMLWRAHPATRGQSIAEARITTQKASGLEDRQYRRRQEPRLLRLVAQAVLDLGQEDDLRQWGRALEVGADVPQSVALYWLQLFADHYFRLETAAFAMQFDYATALSQLRDDLPSWRLYLATAVFWNVQFSYLRDRFFRVHGPLWFTPTDAGGTRLNDAVERIEYHDPFPDEYMARLRRLYGSIPEPDHDAFASALAQADVEPDPIAKAEEWLRRCHCPKDDQGVQHTEPCDVSLVLANCDTCGDTVEEEFTRIQEWYRNPRFAVQGDLAERILDFRSPRTERSEQT